LSKTVFLSHNFGSRYQFERENLLNP